MDKFWAGKKRLTSGSDAIHFSSVQNDRIIVVLVHKHFWTTEQEIVRPKIQTLDTGMRPAECSSSSSYWCSDVHFYTCRMQQIYRHICCLGEFVLYEWLIIRIIISISRHLTRRTYLPPQTTLCFHRCQLVCLLAGLRKKTSQPIFTKFDGKVAHAFGSSPNTEHVTLALGKSYIGFVGGNTW